MEVRARVEWVAGVHADVDVPHSVDFGPIAWTRREEVVWRGHTLRVPPLDLQLAVSERRGLSERAALIRGSLAG